VLLTYWLSFEYVQDPRHALEPESAQAAMQRGTHHVLNLLMPYLEDGQRVHLQHIVGAYAPAFHRPPWPTHQTQETHHGPMDSFPPCW